VTVVDAAPPSDAMYDRFCDLPDRVRYTSSGMEVIAGGRETERLSFMQLPSGFCGHFFANVGNVRQLRFAPGGELFAASPTSGTTGGGIGGRAEIVILPDDDKDGQPKSPSRFLQNLPSTQGILFANDHFYYQDATAIMRRPYATGDRQPSTPIETVATSRSTCRPAIGRSRSTKPTTARIYVGNGGDQGEKLRPEPPFSRRRPQARRRGGWAPGRQGFS